MRAYSMGIPLCVLLGSSASVACSSTSNTSEGQPAPPDASTGTPVDVDGGVVTNPSDASRDAAGAGELGFVFAISDSTTAGADYRAGAFFARVTGVDTTTTTKTVGPCEVKKVGSGTAPAEVDVSAGTIKISGGTKAIDLIPGADKTYDPVSGSAVLWNGGETLTVAGVGKDVPSFTTSLVAPSKLTVTMPTLPSSAASLNVVRSAPFSATWTGASSGTVVLYFDAVTASNAFSATCTFKASAGSAQVPAAAFADFPAVDGSFNFYVKEVGVASPPGWTIRFTASSAMVDSSGAGATGAASFQ